MLQTIENRVRLSEPVLGVLASLMGSQVLDTVHRWTGALACYVCLALPILVAAIPSRGTGAAVETPGDAARPVLAPLPRPF